MAAILRALGIFNMGKIIEIDETTRVVQRGPSQLVRGSVWQLEQWQPSADSWTLPEADKGVWRVVSGPMSTLHMVDNLKRRQVPAGAVSRLLDADADAE